MFYFLRKRKLVLMFKKRVFLRFLKKTAALLWWDSLFF